MHEYTTNATSRRVARQRTLAPADAAHPRIIVSTSVRCQWPIRLGDDSEPQPDIALVRPRENFYEDRHPVAADTLLVIEVSATTLDDDLRKKLHLHTRHGIPEYWVVDVVSQRLHLFRRPSGDEYGQASSVDRSREVEISALPGLSIDLSRIFGS